ncbi:MAG: type II toxin-antitoxin system prevent-host-death family antitoxin [Deltaproteobacteria bacterium]|nr:type II toxin-antitoxin system prevent-host-death family antitoxin [Deltaproteobacteria bacterium]
MNEETVNVAEAKKHLSELLGQVAYGKKQILITKRGKPMARLVPAEHESDRHLVYAKGWLEDEDSFFGTMNRIVKERSRHVPRILKQKSA